jgi:hypothetical protein
MSARLVDYLPVSFLLPPGVLKLVALRRHAPLVVSACFFDFWSA